jgi:uncharacterized protein (DUF4415 family)
MAMSQAALEGIRVNGHGWKARMNGLIKPEMMKLAKFNNDLDGDPDEEQMIITRSESEPVVIAIREKITKWLVTAKIDDDARSEVQYALEELEMIEDCCMGEINYAMNRLFDVFDYYRILVG